MQGLPRWLHRLVTAAFVVCTASAGAAPYSGLYAFGDSLSDVGNIATLTEGYAPGAPYAEGRFSNGPVWVDVLAGSLGLGTVTASRLGGTNYAYGGAHTGSHDGHVGNLTDLDAQLRQFLDTHPAAPSDALYTLWIGSNDLIGTMTDPDPIRNAIPTMLGALRNINSFIDGLAGAGAHNLLVVTVPDLGLTPYAAERGVERAGTAISAIFDALLVPALQSRAAMHGLDLDVVDAQGFLRDAVADPAKYGFDDVTTPCWTGDETGWPSGGTLCSPVYADQNKHLFWDTLHPTAGAHAAIAMAAVAAVPEPDTVVLLAAGLLILAGAARRTTAR